MEIKSTSSREITSRFQKIGITDFEKACEWVRNLPYKRNRNNADVLCVFKDNGGTCSTKHALLKRYAEEIQEPEITLMLGIFNMNSKNTPKISEVLQKYGLIEMPEAHSYLKQKSQILDCTRRNSKPEDFVGDLVEEIKIIPAQIPDFKTEYHQHYLRKYLKENPKLPYSREKFWKIREECIGALQH